MLQRNPKRVGMFTWLRVRCFNCKSLISQRPLQFFINAKHFDRFDL